MGKRKKKATKKVTRKAPAPVLTSAPASASKLKEKTSIDPRCKQIRHILSVIGKQVTEAEDATKYKKQEHLNAALVASETLWQELRALLGEIGC